MIIKVLGSAAGGGFPQWNCNCPNCRDVRLGKDGLRPRTQSSLAVSADGTNWVLLNASPDLRQQILVTPELEPRDGDLRGSPITAVVLTNGDVDHIAGLFCLREGHRFQLFGTDRVLGAVAASSVFAVLNPELVQRSPITLGRPFLVSGPGGLEIEAFAVPGKIALYLEDAAAGPGFGSLEGDTIGLSICDGRSRILYIPGCAGIDAGLAARLTGASLLFFDGTLYHDDEMIRLGLSEKTGARMGHMSMAGAGGSLEALAGYAIGRKIFVHMNNSNPVLHETSLEHAAVRAAGWDVAFDGMEVRL
jgi:pyrroloquinoline quinone biosynthesis protein B